MQVGVVCVRVPLRRVHVHVRMGLGGGDRGIVLMLMVQADAVAEKSHEPRNT